jgi:hypothetical protein
MADLRCVNLGPAFVFLLCLLIAGPVGASELVNQPPDGSGTIYKSAWYDPDGLDGDEYTWENFTLGSSAGISEIRWRGGYGYNLPPSSEGAISAFTINIYRSIAGDSQPDLGPGGRLYHRVFSGNANEAAAGVFGGVRLYDYHVTLPAPFQATAGVRYWVQIEASQGLAPGSGWPPDWGLNRATGGNNSHFRFVVGGMYASITGDLAISLFSTGGATVTIAATASPAGAGTVAGAGVYPVNSTVTLDAAANAGWGFVNWTENGAPVSSSGHYTFTATVNRTLVAHFAPAYTIVTFASPTYGGTTAGDGVYVEGSAVTVTATPTHGFVFNSWSDGSTDAVHTFPSQYDVWLTAFFDTGPLVSTFDFNNAPQSTSLPIDLVDNGVIAHFTATGSGFSVQRADVYGFTPAGFDGLCLMPNSIFAADLIVDFSQALTDFSIMYSPHELGCDDSAIMRVTVYRDGVQVATATTTCPNPGTWPAGVLSITAPAGQTFNRAVVHYDQHPLRCQDYGVIFMADNMIVTRAAPSCPADFNGDGTVNSTDVSDFINQWFQDQVDGTFVTDWDANGIVNSTDVSDFINSWFEATAAGC